MCLAAAAHFIEQGGRGSGADVAACALGGLVEVRRTHAWTEAGDPLRGGARDLLAHPPLDIRAIAIQICARRVELTDVVLRHIFAATKYVVQQDKGASPTPLTVVALGGYGRGTIDARE